jgi:hypothetical protein
MQQSNRFKSYASKKIIKQQRILSAILLIMFGFITYGSIKNAVPLLYILLSIVLGYILGRFFFVRMHRFDWDEENSKVISKMDWIGGIVLLLYIGFAVSRKWILGHWVQESFLAEIGLSLTAGTLIGRLLGTAKMAKDVFLSWTR